MSRAKRSIFTNRWFWIALLVLIILGKIVGVKSDNENPESASDQKIINKDNESASNQTKITDDNVKNKDVNQKTLGDLLKSNNKRLGDSLSSFTSYYGQNYKSNDGYPMYGDYNLVLSESMGVVESVSVAGSTYPMNIETATILAKSFLPNDAVFIGKAIVGATRFSNDDTEKTLKLMYTSEVIKTKVNDVALGFTRQVFEEGKVELSILFNASGIQSIKAEVSPWNEMLLEND